MTKEPNEAERFDQSIRKILSVSHAEFKRREEEWKRQRRARRMRDRERKEKK